MFEKVLETRDQQIEISILFSGSRKCNKFFWDPEILKLFFLALSLL